MNPHGISGRLSRLVLVWAGDLAAMDMATIPVAGTDMAAGVIEHLADRASH